jgi:excisionase family DNA binding protein
MRSCNRLVKITWQEALKKNLLNVQEVAYLLGVHPETVRVWTRQIPPKIKSSKIGSLIRISYDAIKDIVKQ